MAAHRPIHPPRARDFRQPKHILFVSIKASNLISYIQQCNVQINQKGPPPLCTTPITQREGPHILARNMLIAACFLFTVFRFT